MTIRRKTMPRVHARPQDIDGALGRWIALLSAKGVTRYDDGMRSLLQQRAEQVGKHDSKAVGPRYEAARESFTRGTMARGTTR